jgi:AcrR family transcriptional regulator
MAISGQDQVLDRAAATERGPRARMKRHMLDTAMGLMQGGFTPSVSDVAEAAEVSRATAYRYFPSQAAMLQAVVDEALGPVLNWSSGESDAARRVGELVDFAYPRMLSYEATHRAALSLALDQWARRQAGTFGTETRIVRGNRKALLADALAPMRGEVSREAFDKVAQSLSLIFGIEAIVVLKDIWNLNDDGAHSVATWAAEALVRAALAEASAEARSGPARIANPNAAPRPRKTRRRA